MGRWRQALARSDQRGRIRKEGRHSPAVLDVSAAPTEPACRTRPLSGTDRVACSTVVAVHNLRSVR